MRAAGVRAREKSCIFLAERGVLRNGCRGATARPYRDRGPGHPAPRIEGEPVDIVAFGFIALALSVIGFFISLGMGIAAAVERLGERRYVARNARYARRPRIAA